MEQRQSEQKIERRQANPNFSYLEKLLWGVLVWAEKHHNSYNSLVRWDGNEFWANVTKNGSKP